LPILRAVAAGITRGINKVTIVSGLSGPSAGYGELLTDFFSS